jgi:hypothetical protein
MTRQLEITAATVALVTALIGGVVAVESRYAKAAEVKQQLDELYAKQLKLKILEIDLKPDATPADRALRQYLQQELNKAQ